MSVRLVNAHVDLLQMLGELVLAVPGFSAAIVNKSFNAYAAALLKFVDEGAIDDLSLAPNGVVQNSLNAGARS